MFFSCFKVILVLLLQVLDYAVTNVLITPAAVRMCRSAHTKTPACPFLKEVRILILFLKQFVSIGECKYQEIRGMKIVASCRK